MAYDYVMRTIFLIAALALSGCSYSYPIDAVFVGGRLAFDAKKQGSGCIYQLEVTDDSGRPMWSVEGSYQPSSCQSSLPVVYGVAPRGTEQTVRPKRLRTGERYYVWASDGDSYHGSFKLREMIAIDNDHEAGKNAPLLEKRLEELTEPATNSS